MYGYYREKLHANHFWELKVKSLFFNCKLTAMIDSHDKPQKPSNWLQFYFSLQYLYIIQQRRDKKNLSSKVWLSWNSLN